MKQDKNKVAEAVQTLTEALQNDPNLFVAYQANIAMAVYDMLMIAQKQKRQTGRHGTEYLNRTEIHAACNAGAVEFLNRLIGQKQR